MFSLQRYPNLQFQDHANSPQHVINYLELAGKHFKLNSRLKRLQQLFDHSNFSHLCITVKQIKRTYLILFSVFKDCKTDAAFISTQSLQAIMFEFKGELSLPHIIITKRKIWIWSEQCLDNLRKCCSVFNRFLKADLGKTKNHSVLLLKNLLSIRATVIFRDSNSCPTKLACYLSCQHPNSDWHVAKDMTSQAVASNYKLNYYYYFEPNASASLNQVACSIRRFNLKFVRQESVALESFQTIYQGLTVYIVVSLVTFV